MFTYVYGVQAGNAGDALEAGRECFLEPNKKRVVKSISVSPEKITLGDILFRGGRPQTWTVIVEHCFFEYGET